jgi:hypothetical protein
MAVHLGAGRLVLLKSRRIGFGATRRDAAAKGLVDPSFPAVAAGLGLVEVLCLREAGARPCILAP